MVRRERIAPVPNVIDGQSSLALKRKRRRRERKFASLVSKRASTSSSGRARRLQKRFGPSKRRTGAPDVENVRKIVGLNTYIYIYIYIHIYIYDHNRKRRRADRRLVSVGLA